MIDNTHDPGLRCWVSGAHQHPEFPVQNLPFGVFTVDDGPARGVSVIGDFLIDLNVALPLLSGKARRAAEAAAGPSLNSLLAMGAGPRRELRAQLSRLLTDDGARDMVLPALRPLKGCTPHLPVEIGDFTDFYAGIHHATNVGALFRPDQPLMPNYKHVPIGYHGRASSVLVTDSPVRRPSGQVRASPASTPVFQRSGKLDFELELGVWIGPGNTLGEPISIGVADDHVAGYCLLNDWSARDIQAWEYQPLGPFLGKSFATTISPWVITTEAMAPFRTSLPSRPSGDPQPLHYLNGSGSRHAGLAISLEVLIETPVMRARGMKAHTLSHSDARHMYWTVSQMVTHHTSNGCNLRAGDLLGTGTLSAPEPTGLGSLLEMTLHGRNPLKLPSGEQRQFLEDGDTIILKGQATQEGRVTIGFGECRSTIVAAA